MDSRVGAVVMAAGAGRRMGFMPKSLLLRDGVPLIERTVRMLLAAGLTPVVVVLGHHADAIEPVLGRVRESLPDPAQLTWARNPAPDEGQGSSLRTGLAALPQELAAVLVALADQPLLQVEDIQAVLAAWHQRAEHIHLLVPQAEGKPGHPVVFDGVVRRAVMQVWGPAGVREWRRAHPQQVQALACEHSRCVTDIDTPQDLRRLAREHGIELHWPGD